MLAIVSVDKFGDAAVIVAMDDELIEKAIEIVRERNKKFQDSYCYVQQNINYESARSKNLLKKISNFIEDVEKDVMHSNQEFQEMSQRNKATIAEGRAKMKEKLESFQKRKR